MLPKKMSVSPAGKANRRRSLERDFAGRSADPGNGADCAVPISRKSICTRLSRNRLTYMLMVAAITQTRDGLKYLNKY